MIDCIKILCRTGKFSPHVEIPVRNVKFGVQNERSETSRTGLQTPSGREKRHGRGCKPRPAEKNVTDGVANPVRQRFLYFCLS
jgi:hypothetical protein